MILNGKVSVIIPVYNATKYLEACLNSVLQQTYNNIEIIIVNDGSTDSSKEICEYFVSKFKNIKLINQNNGGPSVARNNGINVATGKYIQFVDSDDLLVNDMIQNLVDNINEDSQLVICGYKLIYIQKGIKKELMKVPENSGLKSQEEFLRLFGKYLDDGFINPLWNKLYLLDIIKHNEIYFNQDINMGEDLLFNLQYIKNCRNINVIKDVGYNYMDIEFGSLTRKYRENLFENEKMLFENIELFLINNNLNNNQNKNILHNMYIRALIHCLENIINQPSNLNLSDKIKKINDIVNDEILRNNWDTSLYSKLDIQNRIIILLVKLKCTLSIYYIFLVKRCIRNTLKLRI